VRRSVLSLGVVVEAGAQVADSVLLEGVVVRAGARVVRSVVDRGACIEPEVRVGDDGHVTLVGAGEQVTQDLPAGARQPQPD
jgi:glucose-1-phosphate adenylyltransferase